MNPAGFDFDPAKSARNKLKHGLSFEEFRGFDDEPYVALDDRFDHGEHRYRAFGRIGGLGYMIAYTVRDGRPRLISFRRAHERKMQRHGR